MTPSNRRVVLITGAGRTIGKALALGFAAEGYSVGVTSTTTMRNEEVAREIVEDGGEALAIHLNVADEQSVAAAVDAMVKRYGRIDALVNNAALKLGFVPESDRLIKDLPRAT